MRRRDFIKAVAGSAMTWPLAARAQQAGKLPTIGLLGPNALIWSPLTAAFVERLRQIG
jgi:putative ABC transport system substrate-binding protein